MRRHRIPILALATLVMGWLSAAEAQPIPSSAVALYFVGRSYIDPATGNAEVVGYLTGINGVGDSNSLFNGTPGESTAFFTFRAMLSISSLPSNGDIALLLGSAGTYDIYYNPAPMGDWGNLDTFSKGQLIAHFKRPEFLALQFPSFNQHAITETLLSSHDFIFKGHKYNFHQLTPGGVTLYDYVSNTPLPPAAGFALVLPYGGNGIAVGTENQDRQ